MKFKKIVAILLVTISMIGILGGCMDTVDNELKKEEQVRVVEYFIKHFELQSGEEISQVEVVEFDQNETTRSWDITLLVNEEFSLGFTEDAIGGEIWSSHFSPDEFTYFSKGVDSPVNLSDIEMNFLGEQNE